MSFRPRIVLVTRKTPLDLLLEHHGTISQARFYLASRGRDLSEAEAAHACYQQGLAKVFAAIPADQKRVRVDRSEIDRFLFGPDDVVVIVGQDGLVPNVAKYLSGQRAIGINPDPARFDGVLCRHRPETMGALLAWIESGADRRAFRIDPRVMAEALREDGQRLLALNEFFVGQRTHQSALYRLRVEGREERQSSSGLICATSTGSTGWALSIARQRNLPIDADRALLRWYVREPFPSVSTGTSLDHGLIGENETLEVFSEMSTEGVIFADGMEWDPLELVAGQSVKIGVARTPLNLVVPAISGG